MNVPVAFLCVVLIWSTTPLAIVWSNGLGDPLLAIFLRMLIATIIASTVLISSRITLPLHKQAIKLYCYSSIGVFFAMTLSYLSARYISSGMISLMFGLSPIVSGLLAQKILKEDPFSSIRMFALSLAIIGLCIIFYNNINASLNESRAIASRSHSCRPRVARVLDGGISISPLIPPPKPAMSISESVRPILLSLLLMED